MSDSLKMPSFPVGGVPERSKGTDCKSVGSAFEGSNPSPSTIFGLHVQLDLIVMRYGAGTRLQAGVVQW